VLGLYLLFILTFQIPAVQQWAGHRLASLIAKQLGTSVTIGRAELELPSQLSLYNVLILDQEGKQMLSANRLSARVDLLPLAEGQLSISTAQLFGAHARLYQRTATSKPNFQFVLDSLASKDTTSTSPLNLRINSLIVRQTSVRYDRYDQPETPEQLNPNHLYVHDISAHIILKTLREDSLNVNVKRLTLKEQSGLQIDRLSMRYTGSPRHSLLQDFTLRMPGTNFRLGNVEASYLLRDKQLVSSSLYYRGSIMPSTITLSDLTCLLPALKDFNSTLTVSSNIEGQGEKITIPNLLVTSTTDDIDINIDGWVQDLTDHEPYWQANVNNLKLSAKTLNFVYENLKGRRMEIPPIVNRLGNVHLMGIARGHGIGSIDLRSQLNTDIGKVELTLSMDKQRTFQGHINTAGFNLRRLLADDKFGQLVTDISLEGRLPSGERPTVNAKGVIRQFGYNGYEYRNIDVNGSYSNTVITGLLTIDDPNLGLRLEGIVEKEAHTNVVNLKADIDQFSPQAVHLSDLWGDARFTTNIEADFRANSLSDAVGGITVNGLTMQSSTDHYRLDSLSIASGYENNVHYVRLNSDFAKVDITGDFDYETLTQSVTNFLAATLPTLPSLPKVNPNTHNNFAISATVSKSDWLESLLLVPVSLPQPLTLQGVVNDHTRHITLECDAPHFKYKGTAYRNGHVSLSSPNDSLSYNLQVTRLDSDGDPMEVHVDGKAANNHLHTSLAWDNHEVLTKMSGQLNVIANFENGINGQQTANIRILPSTINIHQSDWSIEPAHITYTEGFADISGFTIRNDQQHLIVNGIVSDSPADSLSVDLRDIDVEYILQLVDFDAVDFNGLATGKGTLRAILGNLQADAQLTVNNFLFQHGRMGTLKAAVDWNKEKEQIDIHAVSNDGPDVNTYIDGYVSPKRNFIDLGIRADNTYLDFAKSFTEDFLSYVDGHGSGALNIIGPLDAINLTGELVLNGTAHVTALGCTYEMRNDTLRMVPNEIIFAHCPVYDIHGNKGMMTGGIHHQDLTNLTFDIFVDSPLLMAYDFPDFGDQNFFGTVFVDGHAAIHGRENETVIEADVTPLQESTFVYNAAAPEVISDQEFIQWGSKAGTSHSSGSSGMPDHSGSLHQNSPSAQSDQTVSPTPLTPFRSDLIFRLKINATPDVTMRLLMDEHTNDYITLHGTGDIQVTYHNKGGFNMFGNYEVSDGTYDVTIQNVIRKNFTFRQGGTIVFSGDPYDALLDLQAQYVVNGVSLSDLNVGRSFSNTVRVNCLMNITGQPRAPIVDFDLDILNVNSDEKQMVRSLINGQDEMRQQVVYLLAVGRFYPQGANNAGESDTDRSSTSLAMQSLLSGTISGQINSVLSQVIKSNNWNFGANISTGDEGWNNAEYEGLVSGRLLNNRLLINGQFGYRDNATTASPSFIGDFDIRYLLYPNGNLALKVYNQTNDRYFTRSSLNTQGIGLIMKKDFNGWRDLFNKRQKKKQRQEK